MIVDKEIRLVLWLQRTTGVKSTGQKREDEEWWFMESSDHDTIHDQQSWYMINKLSWQWSMFIIHDQQYFIQWSMFIIHDQQSFMAMINVYHTWSTVFHPMIYVYHTWSTVFHGNDQCLSFMINSLSSNDQCLSYMINSLSWQWSMFILHDQQSFI